MASEVILGIWVELSGYPISDFQYCFLEKKKKKKKNKDLIFGIVLQAPSEMAGTTTYRELEFYSTCHLAATRCDLLRRSWGLAWGSGLAAPVVIQQHQWLGMAVGWM